MANSIGMPPGMPHQLTQGQRLSVAMPGKKRRSRKIRAHKRRSGRKH